MPCAASSQQLAEQEQARKQDADDTIPFHGREYSAACIGWSSLLAGKLSRGASKTFYLVQVV
jgi:hypothetical protein